jgi:hypothetical protein
VFLPDCYFLLTAHPVVRADIIDQERRLGASVIQIVDDLTAGTYAEMREALSGESSSCR